MPQKTSLALIACLVLMLMPCCSRNRLPVYGTWKLVPEKSTNLVTWNHRTLELEIRNDVGRVIVLNKWMTGKTIAFLDSVSFVPNEAPTEIEVTSQIWPENWYMGVLSIPGTKRKVTGDWSQTDREFKTIIEQPVQTSQGETTIITRRSYRLGKDGNELTVIEKRSSRPTPITLTFERVAAK
ncbi:MAG: hypothetical protein ACOY90_04825 [Candidatus Zhuqueibacterota bacterium]